MSRALKIPCLLYYHISIEAISVKEVDIINRTCYAFDDMINIKNRIQIK